MDVWKEKVWAVEGGDGGGEEMGGCVENTNSEFRGPELKCLLMSRTPGHMIHLKRIKSGGQCQVHFVFESVCARAKRI